MRKEITQLEEMLTETQDERERYHQVRKLSMMRKSPVQQDKEQLYEEMIVERLGS